LKNVTVVIIRDDMLDQCPDSLTAYMNYQTHAAKNSLYNTPPVFPIYAMRLVLERMKKLGGLPAMAELNQKKASLLYDAIEKSDGYYRSPVDQKFRSDMNVVFRLSDNTLEPKFIEKAALQEWAG